MIRQPTSLTTHYLNCIFAVVLLVGAYSWMSYRQHVFNPKDTTIPNAKQFVEGWKTLTEEDLAGEVMLYNDFAATISRHFGGMFFGVLFGVVVGVMMGVWTPAKSFFSWPLGFFSRIPPTAMMAVYFVLFGTEYKMFAAMICLGIFPILAMTICQAVRTDVDDHSIYKAYSLGASHAEVIWDVVFKTILPRIIESIRLQVGPALVFLIAAEMLVGDVGFGYQLRIQSRLTNMNIVYLCLIVLGVSFFVMDFTLLCLRKLMCPWFGLAEAR